MNNYGNNTRASLGGTPHPEIIAYWNIFHLDEQLSTKWIFYTYIDNLSFLGGLLDIILLFPTVIMLGYTFRLNEINVFFHEQLIKNYKGGNLKPMGLVDYIKSKLGISIKDKKEKEINWDDKNYTVYTKYML